VKPPKLYTASVHKSVLGTFLRAGWDVDEDELPVGDRRPICWRHAARPTMLPLGWRAVTGRVWQ
jgi:hypothetical protein